MMIKDNVLPIDDRRPLAYGRGGTVYRDEEPDAAKLQKDKGALRPGTLVVANLRRRLTAPAKNADANAALEKMNEDILEVLGSDLIGTKKEEKEKIEKKERKEEKP